MTMLLSKWTSCLAVLIEISKDCEEAHRDDKKWACILVAAFGGEQEFQRICCFAVECDFFVNASEVIKVHDLAKQTIEVSQADIRGVFGKGRGSIRRGLRV